MFTCSFSLFFNISILIEVCIVQTYVRVIYGYLIFLIRNVGNLYVFGEDISRFSTNC